MKGLIHAALPSIVVVMQGGCLRDPSRALPPGILQRCAVRGASIASLFHEGIARTMGSMVAPVGIVFAPLISCIDLLSLIGGCNFAYRLRFVAVGASVSKRTCRVCDLSKQS